MGLDPKETAQILLYKKTPCKGPPQENLFLTKGFLEKGFKFGNRKPSSSAQDVTVDASKRRAVKIIHFIANTPFEPFLRSNELAPRRRQLDSSPAGTRNCPKLEKSSPDHFLLPPEFCRSVLNFASHDPISGGCSSNLLSFACESNSIDD